MRFTSLRSKIFLLVGLTLFLGAVAVMLVTQRDVTRTVVKNEKLAVRNVLDLLVRDSEARWGGLLSNKISTVRNGRSQLLELGNTIHSVLTMYAGQAARGQIDTPAAQELARQWIDHLSINKERYGFIFNHELTAIASGRSDMRGMDLSSFKDFKGHALAASAYQEARTSGQSFAIYRWPTAAGSGQTELRYAYFGYFAPWDWVFAITDNARDVIEKFDQGRKQMEHSIRQALVSLRLAETGFAFIVADDGELVSPLPAQQTGLLDASDAQQKKTLRALIKAAPLDEKISDIAFDPIGQGGSWEISAARVKPLGWTIVAAVPTEDLTRPATQLRNRLAWLFVLVLLVALAVAWALVARIVRPLQQLSDFARALPEQDLSAAAPIPEIITRLPKKQPDEVGRLAAAFILMDRQLREKVARLLQETTSRERFQSELNIAHDIQMGLLPAPLPAHVLEKVDLYATMIPAKEVGGDLYDYFLLPDGRLCLAIGDVSDKGIAAALFMAITRTLIRASAEDETDPALLMERVNNRLAENNPNMMFVTLVLGVLDLKTGALVWANGGHPPPCVLSPDNTLRLLEGRSGPACGVQEDLPYRSFSTQLEPGEFLLGYTDGVSEAVGPDGSLYGDPRLLDCLAARRHTDAKTLAGSVLQDVRDFAQGTEQSDDITLIAVKRAEP